MQKIIKTCFLCLISICFLTPLFTYATDIPVEAFFAYDKNLPLNLKEEKIDETSDYVKYHISFYSTHDRTVTALLALPKNVQPPFPILMLQHGIYNSKDGIFSEYGPALIKAGYAVFLMDGELHGERQSYITSREVIKYPIAFRDMLIQTVIDLRRAADYLKSRTDLDTERLAYIGYSLGSFEGTIFTYLDKRIKVVVLVVCGSFEYTFAPMKMMPEYKQVSLILDPARYIKNIAPRPLLMINSKRDMLISEQSARILFNAAEQPKEQIFLDEAHVIPQETLIPIITNWLGKNLVDSRQ